MLGNDTIEMVDSAPEIEIVFVPGHKSVSIQITNTPILEPGIDPGQSEFVLVIRSIWVETTTLLRRALGVPNGPNSFNKLNQSGRVVRALPKQLSFFGLSGEI